MILYDQTLATILCGVGILGAISGMVGCFMLLAQKSLYADTISHATLPGICLAFMLMQGKNSLGLIMGGACFALCASVVIAFIHHCTTLKKDTILGIVLACSFGLGTMLLSKIQTCPNASQAGITKYLLGNPSTLLSSDIIIIMITACIVCATIVIFFNDIKLFLFNQDFARSIGLRTTKISCLITFITVLTIVVGLQTAGVILISALLIAPASAAQQWTQNFATMLRLSAFFGLAATTLGTLASSSMARLPTGPMIVVIATCITFFSIFCGPRGIMTLWIKQRLYVKKCSALQKLSYFMLFNESKTDPFHAHDIQALSSVGKHIPARTLTYLKREGFIENSHGNFWRLTSKGFKFVNKVNKSEPEIKLKYPIRCRPGERRDPSRKN